MTFKGIERVRHASRPHKCGALAFLLAMCISLPFLLERTWADTSKEAQVRAVLLLNLCRFVAWPEEAFESAESPLVIGVLGSGEMVPLLEEVARGEEVEGRRIVVERFPSQHHMRACHLLYISNSEERWMQQIMTRLKGQSVLTVSEADRFIRNGGMIRIFRKPDGRNGLRINAGVTRAAGLGVSAMLLRVAEIVNEEDD